MDKSEFVDNYSHKAQNVIYLPQSMPSEAISQQNELNLQGCTCNEMCTIKNNCSCISRSGVSYNYLKLDDKTSYTVQIINPDKPAYECNDNCSCSKHCGHKLVQYGPLDNLKVENCGENHKGLGLFTNVIINNGQFVCEYAGETITQQEANKRFELYRSQQHEMNYIFCINENFGERNRRTFIDPTFYGNIGRYINHSCDPNCTLITVRINDTIPILCVFAKRQIDANEEITYDYGSNNLSDKLCLCQSANCRKFLPYDISVT